MLHLRKNEELQDLPFRKCYSSDNDKGGALWLVKPDSDHFEDTAVVGRIILKWILKISRGRAQYKDK